MCNLTVNLPSLQRSPVLAQVRSLLADRQAWQQWQQRLGPAPAGPALALLPGVPSFAQLPSAELSAPPPGAAHRDSGETFAGDADGRAASASAEAAAAGGSADALDGLLRCSSGHSSQSSLLFCSQYPGSV